MGIKTLPANLKEALDYLEADKVIREALGEHVFENIMRLGLLEWEAYNTFRPSLGDREVHQSLIRAFVAPTDHLFLSTHLFFLTLTFSWLIVSLRLA